MRWLLQAVLSAAALTAAASAGGQVIDLPPGLGPPGASRTAAALDKFSVRAIPSHRLVRPGDTVHVAVEMTVAESFWIYAPEPGGKTIPVQGMLIVTGGSVLEVPKVLYAPAHPHVTDLGDGTSDTHNVYEGKVYAFVEATVPAGTEPGRIELPLTVTGQVCDPSVCLQLETTITAEVEVGLETAASPAWTDEVRAAFAQASPPAPPRPDVGVIVFGGQPAAGAAGMLLLSILAGLLINVMPCVLPVIPLRLLALLNQAGESRRRFLTLGLAFAAGVFLFFAAIALASAVLKLAIGYTLQQADLFRHVELLIAMVLVLTALAANMFGAFTVTVPGKVASVRTGEGHLGAVGMGLLMGILSTPCSFALIASVFAWAQLQPLWLGTVTILLMGVGMSIPHVVLAATPGVVAKIPRAGRWTELFKQSVGFILLGIAVWLLGSRIENSYIVWVLEYALVLVACLWMWGSWVRFDSPRPVKWSVRAAAAAIAVAAGVWMLAPPAPAEAGPIRMIAFDAGRIADARAAGRTVVVKFTAKWCIECFVVDRKIYRDDEVIARLEALNVLTVEGDVTDREMPANDMLYERFGQPGPPLTAVLPPGNGRPIMLRGVFSKEDLFEALEMAGARRGASPL